MAPVKPKKPFLLLLALLRLLAVKCDNEFGNSRVTLNTFFDEVFVVNLDKRPDRLFSVSKSFERNNISFTRIAAIDGRNREYRKKKKLKNFFKYRFSYGALAISDSLRNTLIEAKRKKLKAILFMEDDLVLINDFNPLFSNLTSRVPDDWWVLHLGCNFNTPKNFKFHGGYFEHEKLYQSHAVGIRDIAFDPLIELLDRNLGPIDIHAFRLICKVEHAKCYALFPHLVLQDLRTSDIRVSGGLVRPLDRRIKFFARRSLILLEDYFYVDRHMSVTFLVALDHQTRFETVWRFLNAVKRQTFKLIEIIFLDNGMEKKEKSKINQHIRNTRGVRIENCQTKIFFFFSFFFQKKDKLFCENRVLKNSGGVFVYVTDIFDKNLNSENHLNDQVMLFNKDSRVDFLEFSRETFMVRRKAVEEIQSTSGNVGLKNVIQLLKEDFEEKNNSISVPISVIIKFGKNSNFDQVSKKIKEIQNQSLKNCEIAIIDIGMPRDYKNRLIEQNVNSRLIFVSERKTQNFLHNVGNIIVGLKKPKIGFANNLLESVIGTFVYFLRNDGSELENREFLERQIRLFNNFTVGSKEAKIICRSDLIKVLKLKNRIYDGSLESLLKLMKEKKFIE